MDRCRRATALGSLLTVVALALSGCGILGLNDDIRVFEVQHHEAECFGIFVQLCLLVRESGEADFTHMFEDPAGFEYEWGFVYQIEVAESRIENPPLDGSSIRRVLREVRSKQRVDAGTEFEIQLTGGPGRVDTIGPDTYGIYDRAEFVCASGPTAPSSQPSSSTEPPFSTPSASESPASPSNW